MMQGIRGVAGACALLACTPADGADETSGTTSAASSSGGTTSGSTSAASTSTPTSGPAPTTSTSGTSTGAGPTDTTDAPGTSTGEETGSTTGPGLDCEDLSDGPFAPVLFASGFDGSEDLAFDGQGGLALKRGGDVVVIAADLGETVLAQGVPPAYGTRYLGDGRLMVALPQGGKVITIDAQGTSADFVTDVQGPNGLYPDFAGNVWITEFGGDRVIRVAPDQTRTTIAMGADAAAANGVVYDPGRGLLFYTNYQDAQIRRVPIDGQGNAGAPELVVTLPGTAPDGLALDECGYLYVVDQGNSDLYRVLVGEGGVVMGVPALLATFPSNVANAQFGVGAGFDERTLYVAGNPGDVYALQVEFPGAGIVTP